MLRLFTLLLGLRVCSFSSPSGPDVNCCVALGKPFGISGPLSLHLQTALVSEQMEVLA